VPQAVPGITDAQAVTTGEFHTCILSKTGSITCWGDSSFWQLGVGATDAATGHVTLSGITDAISVVAGQLHTCALLKTGAVRCWGDNSYGELGDGTDVSRAAPADVLGL
jgi:alpha-tubulin suppressor-like RCC1 family protein